MTGARSVRLRVEQTQIFFLPPHRGQDPVTAARMVEEDDLLNRAGTHLAIFTEVDRGLRETVGLTAGVETVHVRFTLLRARVSVQYRCQHKEEERAEQDHERQDRRIADCADLPA